MKVAANHTDPGERIPCVGTCLIESHHMGQMGQLCVLLLQTHLTEGKTEKLSLNCNTMLFISHTFLDKLALICNKG